MQIVRATAEHAESIHRLAHLIWPATYRTVLSDQQIDFMLRKIYAVEALRQSMDAGMDYFQVIPTGKSAVGFMATKVLEDCLRIEKLYLLPESQGQGIGRQLIDFASEQAKQHNRRVLELNVNRGNPAFRFYQKVGFSVVSQLDIPYFGFILDDFLMRKTLIP